MLRAPLLSLALAAGLAAPAAAATDAEIDALFEALRFPELMSILRDEGLAQSAELSDAMFPDRAGGWAAIAEGIYDPSALSDTFRAVFGTALADDDIAPLLDFFTSETGEQVVELELSARTAMLDPDTEEAAIAAYDDLLRSDPDRAAQIQTFVEVNDLIEHNVVGGLNSSLAFYNGLADGGAFEMSRDEILGQVWSQEEDIRAEAAEWLYAYLGMAYRPLEDTEINAYIELSATDAGADLNRAIISAYDKVFVDISYALGAAAARYSMGEDI